MKSPTDRGAMRHSSTLDHILDLISLSLEEKRLIQILFAEHRSLSAKELSEIYHKRFEAQIKSKIYYVLNQLVKRNLILVSKSGKTKYYRYARSQLHITIQKHIREEYEEKLGEFNLLKETITRPPIEWFIGMEHIIHGFDRMEKQVLQTGGRMFDFRDILPFVADTERTLRLRHSELAKQGYGNRVDILLNAIQRRHELLETGLLEMWILMDRIQTEETLVAWENDFGKEYVKTRLRKFIKLLDLQDFVVIFSPERIEIKIEIIEDMAAGFYWRSIHRGQTDRLLIFWYQGIIDGLVEFFWGEFQKSVGKGTVEKAQQEVLAWAENRLEILG